MKKIYFITRHAINNYGSFLQTLATYNFFKNNGVECVLIDYRNSLESPKNNVESYLKKNSRWNSNIIKRNIFRFVRFPYEKRCNKYLEKLIKKHVECTNVCKNFNDLQKLKIEKDCILCAGSDQLWGLMPYGDFDESYFLTFNNENKKISLSSSIGNDKLSIDKFKKAFEKFDYITLRENYSLDILNNLVPKIKKAYIYDPTLLIGIDFWNFYIKNQIIKKKYIFVYQIHHSDEFSKIVRELEKNGNYILRVLPSPSVKRQDCGEKKVLFDPFKFLNYIKYADYILTDSFHGTCFSILFNKNFSVFSPKDTSIRISDLLNHLDLSNRIIKNYTELSINVKNNIAYDEVNHIINVNRKMMTEDLLNRIEGI